MPLLLTAALCGESSRRPAPRSRRCSCSPSIAISAAIDYWGGRPEPETVPCWVLHAVGSELLRDRFRSAVPGFTQVGNWLATWDARGNERIWITRGRLIRSFGQLTNSGEDGEAILFSGLVAADDCQDIRMQPVHAGVGMRPW